MNQVMHEFPVVRCSGITTSRKDYVQHNVAAMEKGRLAAMRLNQVCFPAYLLAVENHDVHCVCVCVCVCRRSTVNLVLTGATVTCKTETSTESRVHTCTSAISDPIVTCTCTCICTPHLQSWHPLMSVLQGGLPVLHRWIQFLRITITWRVIGLFCTLQKPLHVLKLPTSLSLQ